MVSENYHLPRASTMGRGRCLPGTQCGSESWGSREKTSHLAQDSPTHMATEARQQSSTRPPGHTGPQLTETCLYAIISHVSKQDCNISLLGNGCENGLDKCTERVEKNAYTSHLPNAGPYVISVNLIFFFAPFCIFHFSMMDTYYFYN